MPGLKNACNGVRDLGEMMNCWAEDGQMERDFGRGPKIVPFSTFGRVIVLLIRHMFWEWARGVFNRIKITISAFFKKKAKNHTKQENPKKTPSTKKKTNWGEKRRNEQKQKPCQPKKNYSKPDSFFGVIH